MTSALQASRSLLRRQVRMAATAPPFVYQELFPNPNKPKTPYKKLTGDYVKTVDVNGKQVCVWVDEWVFVYVCMCVCLCMQEYII